MPKGIYKRTEEHGEKMKKKKCKICSKEQNIDVFQRIRKYKGKQCYHSYCDKCRLEYLKKYRQKGYERTGKYRERRKKRQITLEYNSHKRIYRKELRKNPRFRLDNSMASLISTSLKGKKANRKWEKLVGYTLNNLIKHLEAQFDDKMNWNNYGSYWWIDHIKPRVLFGYIYSEDPEFKECWTLNNLQPMEKIANIKKGRSAISNT